MLVTLLPRLTLWVSLKGLGCVIETADDIYFPSVHFTKTKTQAAKSIKTTGSSSATLVVKGDDSTLPKPFPTSATLKGFGPHLDGKKVNLK